MDNNNDERNKTQIIRIDAKNCFVESKSDAFEIGKVHLEFMTYDTSKPEGQRKTNNVHIYIDIPDFLCLAQEALSGMLHARARQQRVFNESKIDKDKDRTPLYQSLGGTSAARLKHINQSRPDGMSISRTVQLILGKKDDFYLFIADSGPGETDSKGLIVPKFGNNPENHVAVSMGWRALNEIMMMTRVHYEAWLASKYVSEIGSAKPQTNYQAKSIQSVQPQQNQSHVPPPQNNGAYGSIGAAVNGEDLKMF